MPWRREPSRPATTPLISQLSPGAEMFHDVSTQERWKMVKQKGWCHLSPKVWPQATPRLVPKIPLRCWSETPGKGSFRCTWLPKSQSSLQSIYIYILYDTWTVHKLELQMLEFSVIDNSCYIVWQCRTLQAESPKNNPTQQPHRGPAVPVRPALEAWLRPHVKSRASCGRSWEMISIIDGYVFMDPWCIMNQRAQKKSS